MAVNDRMKIRVVDATLRQETWRFQPGRYVVEVSRHLIAAGHDVQVLSGGAPPLLPEEFLEGIVVRRFRSARYPYLKGNSDLDDALRGTDLVLWHTGLTGLLHLRPSHRIQAPLISLMTSPLPTWRELLPLGPSDMVRHFPLHLLSAFLPRPCPAAVLGLRLFRGFIVMNNTTASRLERLGVRPERIQVVPAGVDSVFLEDSGQETGMVRSTLGVADGEYLILYFGSAEPYRGLPDLMRALALALHKEPRLRLLVLSRRRQDEFNREEANIQRLGATAGVAHAVLFKSGFLTVDEIAMYVRAADIVALPFRAVPSGTPLSVLEALAAGKPVITTAVDCLPEVVPTRSGYCVAPRDPSALAKALLQAVRQFPRGSAPTFSGTVPTWKEAMEGLDSAVSDLISLGEP